MIINGETYACEACIRGHRTANCQHKDRPLQLIKKKGRPVSQCNHCRSMRQARSAHVKCECAKRAREGKLDQATVNGGREPCRCFEDGVCRCAFKRDHTGADVLSPSGSEQGTNASSVRAANSSPETQGCCGTPSTTAPTSDAPSRLDGVSALDAQLPPPPVDDMMDFGTSWLDAIPHNIGADFADGEPFDFANLDMQPGSFDFAAVNDVPPAPGATHMPALDEVPESMVALSNHDMASHGMDPAAAEWMPNQYGGQDISVFGVPESAWLASLGMSDSKIELLPGDEEAGRTAHGQ
ncbi:copper fist DNA binding domain-containing protein [Purpureocillium lavendulum]|uniref:Copper fist DNA binding domain-containing protein n=1 Tax=Purpureocillium lavendulum TaxID=1247861 RepID=A0AB34G5S4_9HYPO|nr:copper fist DNA binding domain-containing protein [Purpureocillium lavendulum]